MPKIGAVQQKQIGLLAGLNAAQPIGTVQSVGRIDSGGGERFVYCQATSHYGQVHGHRHAVAVGVRTVVGAWGEKRKKVLNETKFGF